MLHPDPEEQGEDELEEDQIAADGDQNNEKDGAFDDAEKDDTPTEYRGDNGENEEEPMDEI